VGLFQRAGLILDCHVHLLPPRRLLKLIEWARRFFPGHPVPETIALEELLAEFEAQGIRALLNFAHAIFPDETDVLNRFNHELATRYPQVLPVGTLHPESPEPLLVVSQCLDEYGFLGLKFHAFVQKFLPWEPRMRPVYEAVAARGRLLLQRYGCATCHGLAGEGGVVGPKLDLEELWRSDFQLVVRSGPGGMPALTADVLSDEDLETIYAYLKGIPQ